MSHPVLATLGRALLAGIVLPAVAFTPSPAQAQQPPGERERPRPGGEERPATPRPPAAAEPRREAPPAPRPAAPAPEPRREAPPAPREPAPAPRAAPPALEPRREAPPPVREPAPAPRAAPPAPEQRREAPPEPRREAPPAAREPAPAPRAAPPAPEQRREAPPPPEPRREAPPAARTPPAAPPVAPEQRREAPPAARTAPNAETTRPDATRPGAAPAPGAATPAPTPNRNPEAPPAPRATPNGEPRPEGTRPGAPPVAAPVPEAARPPAVANPEAPRGPGTLPVAPPAGPPRGAADPTGRGGRLNDLRTERRETREGDRTIITEPGGRVFIQEGGRTIIRRDESERFRYGARDVQVQQRGGETVTVVDRPDGDQVVTYTDRDGNLIRRSRRGQDGREIVIIDNRPRPGDPRTYFVDLPPPVIRIPRDRYIVDAQDAPYETIYDTFLAPPVERIDRRYTLDEIRYSPQIRARMPRVDIDTVTFASGSWEVAPDQTDRLSVIARALGEAIRRNPREVFLIEGHTDATGSAEDNLSLSDRRAESVAVVLQDSFRIPPENLTTQGYGEQQLKVPSSGPERANRRVTIRRITPLLTGDSGGPPPR